MSRRRGKGGYRRLDSVRAGQSWLPGAGNFRGSKASSHTTGPVTVAIFSPDGQTILTASPDGTARLWNVATGEPKSEPLLHEGRVLFAAFSPDGKTVVTASSDRTARLWDVATGQQRLDSLAHDSPVDSRRSCRRRYHDLDALTTHAFDSGTSPAGSRKSPRSNTARDSTPYASRLTAARCLTADLRQDRAALGHGDGSATRSAASAPRESLGPWSSVQPRQQDSGNHR